MAKFKRGKIVTYPSGGVQYVENLDRGVSFLLVTGRHADLYIPVEVIRTALEDEWENEKRHPGWQLS